MSTYFKSHGSEITFHDDSMNVNENRIYYHEIVRQARELNPLPTEPLSYLCINIQGHKIELFPDTGNVWVSSLDTATEFTLAHSISNQARQLVSLAMDVWQDNINLAKMTSFREEIRAMMK